MVCHQIRLLGDGNFSYWLEKKKKRNFLFAYVDVHFSCQMMHSRDA